MTGLVAVEGSPPIRSALLSDLVALLNRNYWFLLSLNTLSPFPHQTLPSSSSEVFIYNLRVRTLFFYFFFQLPIPHLSRQHSLFLVTFFHSSMIAVSLTRCTGGEREKEILLLDYCSHRSLHALWKNVTLHPV